jgi:hypothetical protein
MPVGTPQYEGSSISRRGNRFCILKTQSSKEHFIDLLIVIFGEVIGGYLYEETDE